MLVIPDSLIDLTLKEYFWVTKYLDPKYLGTDDYNKWQFAVAFEEAYILASTDPGLKSVMDGYRLALKDIMNGYGGLV